MKVEVNFEGKIKQSGKNKRLVLDNDKYFQKQIQSFKIGQKVEGIIKNKSYKRTKNQNAYWHKVCFPVIGELMGETSSEAKKICKAKFILPDIKKDPETGEELEIPRGSSDLDVSEAWEFTTAMITLAHFLGGKILTPCEAGYSCGRRECDICSQKFNVDAVEYPDEDIDPDKIPF